MALKAGRVGVAQDQVDLFGNIIGSGDSYTKTETDEKFLSKSDAASTYAELSDLDEYTTAVTQASGKATFSNLNPAYGYEINVVIPDEVGTLPTAATALTIPKYTGIKRSTNADGTINLEYSVTGTDGSTQFKLRMLK